MRPSPVAAKRKQLRASLLLRRQVPLSLPSRPSLLRQNLQHRSRGHRSLVPRSQLQLSLLQLRLPSLLQQNLQHRSREH